MSAVESVTNFLGQYPEIERFGKDTSHKLYLSLTDNDQNFFTYLRAMGIPFVSALNLVCKLITDICCAIHTIIQSIVERRYTGGNLLTLLISASEYCQNLLGLFFGIPVALFSPQYAAHAFLTADADSVEPFIPEVESAKLYAMADRLHAFFVTNNIDYRICCGTALGAKREKGVIRNDDDIDLMIHPKDVERFNQLVDNGTFSKQTGISITEQAVTGGWQCFYDDSPKGDKGTPLENTGFPFVDIFPGVYRQHKNEWVITYGEYKMYYQSPGDYFTESEWGEPVIYDFGPTKLFGIEAITTYLERCYGALALDYVAKLYPHEVYSNAFGNPLKLFTTPFQYASPRYFKHTHPTPQGYDEKAYQEKIGLGSTVDEEAVPESPLLPA